MKIIKLLIPFLVLVFVINYIAGDNSKDPGQVKKCSCVASQTDSFPVISGALLASRFNSLEELKTAIDIDYYYEPYSADSSKSYSRVELTQCSKNIVINSVLESGISQGDIYKVKKGGTLDRIGLLVQSPFAVANRMDLIKVYTLARWKQLLFGENDVAFYDLAEAAVNNISTPELAYRLPRDSSDKGYINSFNHITAQALITSCFSEELADFLADVHERQAMPELTTGRFTNEQLSHADKNPVDNYVDMINNEWGQEIGKKLKTKFNITKKTKWTPELLSNYLNELQAYYSQAFQIGFKPNGPKDELVRLFSNKINRVMNGAQSEI